MAEAYEGSERWAQNPGIVPLGKIRRSVSLLTPEEQEANEEHDRLLKQARDDAMKE